MEKKVIASVIAVVAGLLFSTGAGAGDVMSWSPRTPAGGAQTFATFYLEVATAVKEGPRALIDQSLTGEQVTRSQNFAVQNGELVLTQEQVSTTIREP